MEIVVAIIFITLNSFLLYMLDHILQENIKEQQLRVIKIMATTISI